MPRERLREEAQDVVDVGVGVVEVAAQVHGLRRPAPRGEHVAAHDPVEEVRIAQHPPVRVHPQPGQPETEVNEVTLTRDGDRSVMVWEVRGIPLNLLAAYGAGVQLHVEDLAAYLDGRESWRSNLARFDELMAAYRPLATEVS